ncbi:MAG: membrane protein insertase YidC [Rectinemataceae bacterium]|jgi:YidC/Oxa1 family membrane protein insertase
MNILDNNNKTGDKRTLLAVVLSVVVITAGFLLQATLFPPTPAQAMKTAQPSPATGSEHAQVAPAASTNEPVGTTTSTGSTAATGTTALSTFPSDAPVAERTYTVSTDILEAVFTNKGGEILSLKLKKHSDKDGAVNLIVPGTNGAHGLSLAFGDASAVPVTDLMNAVMLDNSTIVFSRTYLASVPGKDAPVPFILKKTYTFRNGDYMFGLAVGLENSVNEILPLDAGGIAYSLTIGPQIGPKLRSLPGNSNTDYRKFVQLIGGKKKEEHPKAGVPMVLKDQPSWIALSGKYFSLIAVPDLSSFTTTISTSQDPILFLTDSISLSRPAIKASKQTDTYYFYFGPKTNSELSKYDYADRNAFQQKGLNLEQAAESSGILGWLETIIKFFLNFFFNLVPNYGVAIILVTILVKALLFPLTKNGSVSAARMQELQPKMKELQAKYKGNPQKLNQEMAEFYKKEGYNPMSGCLPLIIQFPIFIAMYSLFNNHFDLRGALFIPGWIPDLSQPEAILSFPMINLMIWKIDAIRALPIIYVVSQLLYGKYTQMTSPGQSATQMKIMMYGMPIMFFFILYNTPSGLLLYWIVSNVLSIGQQIVINDILKKRRSALAAAAPAPVIAPNRKPTKNKKK